MLRDWTASDKVNEISVHAERFFVRLIMKVDDYGCFYADTRMLKANLFPLLLDKIREADLLRWTAECQKAGLIVLYEAEGKRYLQIVDFKQRLDRAHRKFPNPENHINQPLTVVNDFPPEVEVEREVERRMGFAPPSRDELRAYCLGRGYTSELADKVFDYYDSADWKDSKGKQVKSWKQKLISVWFKDEYKITNKPNRYASITKTA